LPQFFVKFSHKTEAIKKVYTRTFASLRFFASFALKFLKKSGPDEALQHPFHPDILLFL